MNHDLVELYGEPNILTVVKAGRIRWLEHVMRMPASCPTKKVFNSDPQFGIRRRGAQRTRWLDQVKRDLCHNLIFYFICLICPLFHDLFNTWIV